MQIKRVETVDALTGEVMEGATLAVVFPKRRNGFQVGGWLAMAQQALLAMAKADLGAEALRVLLVLCARLDFENWIRLSQADIARELGMKPPSVHRAITRLLGEGIILEGPRVGTIRTWRLNPAYGWKGSAKGHQAALRDHLKLVKA